MGKHRPVIRNLQKRRGYHLGFMEDAGSEDRHLQQRRRRHGRGCSTTLQCTQLKCRTTVPLHLIWGTRLCQALFCKGGWIQGEFCLVLMEPLYNELANLQRRGINAPIKKQHRLDQQPHKGKKKPPGKVKNCLSKWRNHLAELWKEVTTISALRQASSCPPWARQEHRHRPVRGRWLSERWAGKSCAQKPEDKFSTDSELSFGFLL